MDCLWGTGHDQTISEFEYVLLVMTCAVLWDGTVDREFMIRMYNEPIIHMDRDGEIVDTE